MKTTFFYSLLLLFIFACGSANEKANLAVNSNSTLEIEGMTCQEGCANYIERKVAKMEGVQSCKVDFEGKMATVIYDDNQVNEEKFKELIEGLEDNKYKVSNIETEKISKTNSDMDRNSGEDDESVIATPSFEMPNLLDYFRNII